MGFLEGRLQIELDMLLLNNLKQTHRPQSEGHEQDVRCPPCLQSELLAISKSHRDAQSGPISVSPELVGA